MRQVVLRVVRRYSSLPSRPHRSGRSSTPSVRHDMARSCLRYLLLLSFYFPCTVYAIPVETAHTIETKIEGNVVVGWVPPERRQI